MKIIPTYHFKNRLSQRFGYIESDDVMTAICSEIDKHLEGNPLEVHETVDGTVHYDLSVTTNYQKSEITVVFSLVNGALITVFSSNFNKFKRKKKRQYKGNMLKMKQRCGNRTPDIGRKRVDFVNKREIRPIPKNKG